VEERRPPVLASVQDRRSLPPQAGSAAQSGDRRRARCAHAAGGAAGAV